MKDIVNERVKHREPFRPFAPSVLEERTGRLLVFGGTGADIIDELWSYWVSRRDWTREAEAYRAAFGYSAVWDPRDSQILFFGGSPMSEKRKIVIATPSRGRL